MSQYVYLVTDIETDGPFPGDNSMLSFASVACSEAGETIGEFEVNLTLLPQAQPNAKTMVFWGEHPEAWEYCRRDAQSPDKAMAAFARWIKDFQREPVFVAHPTWFDFAWILYYCEHFLHERVFHVPAVDIATLVMAVTGREPARCHRTVWPPEWFGGYAHTHRAIDDARGYAHAFQHLRRMQQERFPRSLHE